jgi:hypothetical protein
MTALWKSVWKVRGPPVIKLFLWKACRNVLATKENLHRRTIISDPLCPICELENESVGHILWSCGSAKDVWLESIRKIQKSSNAEKEFINIFIDLVAKLDLKEMQLFAVIACNLWLWRNTFMFGGPLDAPAVVICKAKEQVEAFEQAEETGSSG